MKGDLQHLSKKTVISNKELLGAFLFMAERIATKNDLLAMATKDDFEYLKHNMATKKDIASIKDDLDIIGENVDSVQRDTADMVRQKDIVDMATKDDLAEFATRSDVKSIVEFAVDKAKGEILEKIDPMSCAQDSDSVTIINHEERIVRIEKQLELA